MGRAWWSSIRTKAIGVVFGVAGALVVFLSVYFAERQVAAIQAGLRDKAATYARLVSRQVESGVAFDDRETVREVFTATAEDRDVAALALFDAEGHRLFATGETRIERPRSVERVELSSVPGAIRATAPVVSREGPRGTLVLDITTARLVTERRAIEHTARAVGVVALAAGF
ncbi:MAG TPA: CHASE sensor domain-containing protein, partial [Polyangiaceae bacterium]